MTDDRKPKESRIPAKDLLNKFLKDNNILLGTDRPQIDYGSSGTIVIYPPRVIAVYNDEPRKPKGIN